jgi:glycosyltransferase involved in cell wall biosynthesis
MPDDASWWPEEEHRQPSVSVVIPTQPPAPRLERVIERLLAQRYDGTIEVLVVVDRPGHIAGVSPPPSLTGSIRRAVRTIMNTGEPGVEGARRTGRVQAHGEIVVFSSDDEEWPPDRLREVVVRRFAARRFSDAPWTMNR